MVGDEEETAQRVVRVDGCVGLDGGGEHDVAEHGADHCDEGCWDEDAEEGQGENLPRGSAGWVVDVVVRGHGTPSGGGC